MTPVWCIIPWFCPFIDKSNIGNKIRIECSHNGSEIISLLWCKIPRMLSITWDMWIIMICVKQDDKTQRIINYTIPLDGQSMHIT